MNQDDFSPSESTNPFSSPTVESVPEVRPGRGPGFICDGTALDALSQGWNLMKTHFWLLLGIMLLALLVRSPGDNMDEACEILGIEPSPILLLGSTLYAILVGMPITFGLAYVYLLAARGEKFEVSDLFGAFQRNYGSAVGAGFVKMVVIVLGCLLLLVPGIYLAIKLAFVEYLVVDRKLSIFAAFKKSWEMTNDREWTLLLLGFLSLLIFIVGLLACLVGVIFSAMLVSAAYAVLFYCYELRSQEEQDFRPEANSDNPFAN